MLLYFSILVCSVNELFAEKTCSARYFQPDGIVCVCNSSYCDTVAPVQKLNESFYVTYTTNKAGLRFKKDIESFNSNETQEDYNNATIITINHQIRYQEIIGFGGAITDSAALNIYSLKGKSRENLMISYFSKDGIECNTARIPMGGTDFSSHAYSYDDGPPDPLLLNFNLVEEDIEYKIPVAKWAKNITNNNIYFFTSTWTAPKWMKTNHQYNGTGFLKREMYKPWANYFHKFLEEYHKYGVEFWGITNGNEPGAVFYISKINSVGWLPTPLGFWIEYYLGPTLRSSTIRSIKNIQIIILDDIIKFLPWTVDKLLANKQASRYVSGIAVHWYADSIVSYDVLTQTHDNHPEKFILATEASLLGGVKLGSWKSAEKYIIDIISDLQNWVAGWTEWNIALDLQGGPTYIDNVVDASLVVNAADNEFYKQPTFYVFGHFSKFLPRGSTRINSTVDSNNLRVVAFKRPDDGTAVIVFNQLNTEMPLKIKDDSRGTIYKIIPAKSITTFLYW